MGIVFGSTKGLEMPAFEVLASASGYEVRRYAPSVLATAAFGDKGWAANGSDGSPFGALARYIGVFGKPKNQAKSKISMTAPVLVDASTTTAAPAEPIAMTAPVLVSPTGTNTMSFVLPASLYKSVDEAPRPTDPRVTIHQLPERVQAVRTFSYKFSHESSRKNLELLLADLEGSSDWAVKRGANGEPRWQAAGYNPPFSLPFMKRNEVLVEVDPK